MKVKRKEPPIITKNLDGLNMFSYIAVPLDYESLRLAETIIFKWSGYRLLD